MSVSVRGATCFLGLRSAKHKGDNNAAAGDGGSMVVSTGGVDSAAQGIAAAKRIQQAFRQVGDGKCGALCFMLLLLLLCVVVWCMLYGLRCMLYVIVVVVVIAGILCSGGCFYYL